MAGCGRGMCGGLPPRVALLDPAVVKIVVCHHPFDAPAGRFGRLTFPRPDSGAMSVLAAKGVDVFLTGHLHVAYTGQSAIRYKALGRAAIVVEAGTAASTRVRGETNSFNLLRVEKDQVTVHRLAWNESAKRFGVIRQASFTRSRDGWVALEDR